MTDFHLQGRLPDENFAREFMQLFTIGLWELDLDGARRRGGDGELVETYTNADVMAFARVWTGWDQQPLRGNFAGWAEALTLNAIDPMKLYAERRDTYVVQVCDPFLYSTQGNWLICWFVIYISRFVGTPRRYSEGRPGATSAMATRCAARSPGGTSSRPGPSTGTTGKDRCSAICMTTTRTTCRVSVPT